MFDKGIVSADSFTEMSSDAQSLYFHLGMQADDEGFVSPKGIMRMISAPEDALRILAAKGFVILFESGVVVITDWNENNFLDSRRIKSTQYGGERKKLSLTNNKRYELSIGSADAKHPLNQYSIEESSIGEHSIEENGGRAVKGSKAKYGAEGAWVLKSFESVDPKNKTYYSNVTQRFAADFLISEYGRDRISRAIEVIISKRGSRGFPSITSPWELKEKWTKIGEALMRQKSDDRKPTVLV